MDSMRYEEAFGTLTEKVKQFDDSGVASGSGLARRVGEILHAQCEFLDNVKGEDVSESVWNLVDLYYNMLRSWERGAYADVLARFWRLREGAMYYILRLKGLKVQEIRELAGLLRQL